MCLWLPYYPCSFHDMSDNRFVSCGVSSNICTFITCTPIVFGFDYFISSSEFSCGGDAKQVILSIVDTHGVVVVAGS